MATTLRRIGAALAAGCALVALATLCQPHFVAGSLADFLCELILLPGKLLAVPFHDRGSASPEFLWRSRVFGAVLIGVLVYLVLTAKKRLTAKHEPA
jgi:hypothetical protein